jgi:hypothetical protein
METSNVTVHSLTPAGANFAASGLLAWALVEVNGVLIEGVALRITCEDELVVTLPAKAKGELGRRRPIVRIPDQALLTTVHDAVIRAFRDSHVRLRNGGDA